MFFYIGVKKMVHKVFPKMRLLLFVTAITLLSISLVYGDKSVDNERTDAKIVNNEDNFSTTKTKRGIHPLPYGQSFARTYSPYARIPSVYKGPVATYAITPGNAVVHSFNVNYPKLFIPKPVLRPTLPSTLLVHSQPILASVPVYANRYPFSLQKPIIKRPIIPIAPLLQFSTPAFIPSIHSVNSITVPNVPQDGWRPIFSQSAPSSQPSSNYYLPPDPSLQQHYHHHHQQQHDLQAHLQQLQEIQQHQHFLRSEQNDGIATPLSEQGYETASNNGRYTGLSSYQVSLNSRGQLN